MHRSSQHAKRTQHRQQRMGIARPNGQWLRVPRPSLRLPATRRVSPARAQACCPPRSRSSPKSA
eukprot:14920775-Alexandrium_andersonii.AAC.1